MIQAKTVDGYLESSGDWRPLLEDLRELLVDCGLEETVKWGMPCYTHRGKNVIGLAAFQKHCGLWFHQGASLSDPEGLLVNAQEGKTKNMRHWRMTKKSDVKRRLIKAYVREAMEVAEAPPAPKPKTAGTGTIELPVELQEALAKSKPLRAAFEGLTPGRQREYARHVAEAKREATRRSRVEKSLPLIRAGVGLHDKYRDC